MSSALSLSDCSTLRMPLMRLSRSCRLRITSCAFCGSFQSEESSARAFSSASSRIELSQSKMPPEQAQGLLDFGNGLLGFSAHGGLSNQLNRNGGPLNKG